MLEFYVGNPSQIEDVYKQDISDMTAYLKMEVEPKKEDIILFDKEDFSFSGNWKVAYSNYLTKLYGYKNQMEYEEWYKPLVARFNRTFRRIVEENKMTDKNLEAIKEMKTYFDDFDDFVKLAKAKKPVFEEANV